MAQINVNHEQYDIGAIAIASGQSDANKIRYNAAQGVLIVDDVPQNDLDVAFAEATPMDTLQMYKESTKTLVDIAAGKARKRHITSVDGQEMTYIKKEIDAEAFKAAGYPEVDIANYPWIEAEAIATDDSGQQVADAILAQRDAWITVGAEIEKQRRLGKVIIDQQLTEDAVNTARANAIAALEAI